MYNGWDDNLWVYMGNGDGTSALPTIIPLKGNSPLWITTADLRNLKRADIIVAEHDSNTIGVLLSNGDGTFQPELQISALAIGPDFVTVADVNGDGFPDVVAGGGGCATVNLGDGQGNFGSPHLSCLDTNIDESYLAPNFTTFVSLADFDKDGKLDILISNPGFYIEVLHGDGAGNFSSPVKVIGGSTAFDYYYLTSTALDFNGDGCPDVVAGNSEGYVFFFAGDCTGHFAAQAAESVDAGDIPAQLSVADINGDGHPDLVATGVFGPSPGVALVFPTISAGHMLSVMYGDGVGDFSPAQVFRGGDNMVSCAIGDLNGDGKPDVLAVAQDEDGLYEFLNDGTGNFGYPQGRAVFQSHGNNNQQSYPVNIGGDDLIFFQDVNGDGMPDAVYIDYAQLETTYSAGVSLNQGARGFAAPVFSTIDTDNNQVIANALGDFHGNGQPDLVITTDPSQPGGPGGISGAVMLMQNLGAGKFAAPVSIYSQSNSETNVAAADMNNDGKQDLLICETVGGPQLTLLLGNGNGTFRPPLHYPYPAGVSGEGCRFYFGDFNGDGKADVLLYIEGNVFPRPPDVVEYLGNGDGTFQPAKLLLGSPGIAQMAMMDLNHDGRLDIVTQDQTAQTPEVDTYFGQGDGTFAQMNAYTSFPHKNGMGFSGVLAGDFNADDNVDVAVPLYLTDSNGAVYPWAQFYVGAPDGTFQPTADTLDRGYGSQAWIVADIDGTSQSSIVELDNLGPSFHVMKGTSAPPFQLFLASEAVVGDTLQGAVRLNQASSTDTNIDLAATDPAVTLPGSITIPAGASQQTFTLTLNSGFHVFQVLGITASTAQYQTTAYAFDQSAVTPLTVSAPNLQFGFVPVHTTSPALIVTVTNDTLSSVTLTNIVFNPSGSLNANAADFSEADNCHSALVPGAECVFNVTFTPSVGNQGEVTELDFNDPISGRTYRFVFSGTGQQPVGSISPPTLSFPPQFVNSTSSPQTVYLTNTGSGNLVVSNIRFTGPFQTQTTCPVISGGVQTCPIAVTFTPLATGTQTGSLTIVDNDTSDAQTVSLSGTGIPAPTLSISPSSLSFSGQLVGTQSAPQTITLTNTSGQSVTFTSIAVTGSSAFPESQTCGAQLPAGQNCSLSVSFLPAASGQIAAGLTITDNGALSPQMVSLTATGLDYKVILSNNSATVSAGSSVAIPLSLVSSGGSLPDAITMSCSGLPQGAACAFSPSSAVASAGGTNLTLSINTTGANSAALQFSSWSHLNLAVFLLPFPFFFCGDRRRRWIAMILLMMLLSVLIACGGGSSAPLSNPNRTLPGNYSITVIGSDGGQPRSALLTLTVQ